MKKRELFVAAGLLTVGGLVGFAVKALAQGIPSPNPLYYSGTLTEGGQLVNGSRPISINLWLNPTATTGESALCVTSVPSTPVVSGRFRVVLSTSCTAVIAANPNVYVEVVDNGTSLGRAPVGAVPYAVEAQSAVSATNATNATNAADGGALATAVSTLQQSVGTLQGNLVSYAAYVTNNGTPAINLQVGGTWLTGVTRVSAGLVTLTIASGLFPATQHELCVATSNANTSTTQAATATLPFVLNTSVQVATFFGATATDSDFLIVCVGPPAS
ncbi:MAG TPA: hypothetical protein VEK07_15875 [Polyangiaceae bacterium]|nr:hypothetical protein [Polyangiaceae bacterium]